MSFREMTKGGVNKARYCTKGPSDAMSHFMAKSNFRNTQKLIPRYTAHIFFFKFRRGFYEPKEQ